MIWPESEVGALVSGGISETRVNTLHTAHEFLMFRVLSVKLLGGQELISAAAPRSNDAMKGKNWEKTEKKKG